LDNFYYLKEIIGKFYKVASYVKPMSTLTFETLTFHKHPEHLQVDLLHLFTTKIPLAELEHIAVFSVVDTHTIAFEKLEEEKARLKFSFLLSTYFDMLKTKLTGNKATYIHRNSGIPLIGNVAFGIVYRNSSVIEIKTNNACNLNCVYCSISEGLSSTKNDFVIEKDGTVTILYHAANLPPKPGLDLNGFGYYINFRYPQLFKTLPKFVPPSEANLSAPYETLFGIKDPFIGAGDCQCFSKQ
jgi:uncharacterized Fe-S cluster-containing radical SAM superfamily enzyme